MKSLTNEDISVFKKNGYLIKRKVFNDNEITEIVNLIGKEKKMHTMKQV